MTTADLVRIFERKKFIPEDDDEAYVAFYHSKLVEEEDDEERQIFTIIWAAPRMLKRLTTRGGQNDATYKLSWFDWPCFISGVSYMTSRLLKGYFVPSYNLIPSLVQVFHDPHGPDQSREHLLLGQAAGLRKERDWGGAHVMRNRPM